jgi:peroxiredoxin (alkyl hydroperoxide reductase subunit C)
LAEDFKPGCNRPEIKRHKPETQAAELQPVQKEADTMVKVGKPAPLFEAPAFHEGKFKNISLEDYKGKWVLLCFYPGDFTFV